MQMEIFFEFFNRKYANKMENPAIKKRILIVSTFATIFVATVFIIFYTFSPAPTCTDGIRNQSEKGVDCGGVCAPCKEVAQGQNLVVKEVAVVSGGDNTFDAVAKIANPNDSVGASSFKYTFSLKDAKGTVLTTREGSGFILPADSRYIAELGFRIDGNTIPLKAEIAISDVKWEKIGEIGKPQLGVYSKNFGKTPTGNGSQADGVIRNESGYNLGKILVVIVLRDEKGEIVGVNKTEKNSVRTREERDFHSVWPYRLSSPVQSMEIDTQSDVFDLKNLSFSS